MQIKVFKAGNMKDAMTAMKEELGDEAIILHSKKYKEGGLLGIGSREVVEITAAVEELSMPKKIEPPSLKHPTVAPNSILTRYKLDGTEEAVAEAERLTEDEPPAPVVEPVETVPKPEEQKNFEAVLQAAQAEETSTEEKSLQVEEAPTERPVQVEETPSVEEKNAQVEEISPPEEKPAPVEETSPSNEKSAPVEESPATEEQPAQVEESPATEEQPAQVEESPATEEQPVQVEETSTEEKSVQVEESPATEEKPAQSEQIQQQTVMMQEQLAQTQAMIMAQFNQMQMMQQAVMAQAQAQAQTQEQQPNPQNEEKLRRLEDEILQMKALLAEVLGRDNKKGEISLHEALRLQEVDEEILTEMATQSNAGDTLLEVHAPAAKATLVNYLNEHLKFSDGIKLNRHGVRIVALLGTTGVGKTTTLAKIAAKFVLEQRTNVALITADTYRISAVEQLKTYSDILELPLEIVYTPAELASAIERYRDKDLILIDTAGRSQHNEYQMRELEDFLRVNPRIEKHLVISATTKLTDARQIMNKFKQVEPDKIIFTKTDETGTLGMIMNLLRDSKYSLSYLTTGQSVPDDIERANIEILTALLMKKVDEL